MTASPPWPTVTWTTPVLRRLDDAARAAVVRAGRAVAYSAAAIYREGDPCESFFVVTEGAVELHAIRRGDAAATLVRTARPGESFGEEALLPGLARRLTATTRSASVVEIPVAVFVRAARRGEHADRERRHVERAAARDLLACSAFARDLDGGDVDLLLDAVRLERVARGTRIYEPGASADAAYPTRTAAPAASMSRMLLRSLAVAATIALVASGWAIHRGSGLAPSHGGGLIAGLLAGLLVIALAAYVVPKRLRAKPRPEQRGGEPRPAARSRLRPHFLLHLGLGAIVPAAALAHAGLHARDGTGAALIAALALTAGAGVLAALAYAVVPPALTRLERRGALPEDLAGERDALEARLYQAISGASDRAKTLAGRILLPYARARLGPARLVASGLRIADERARLRAEIFDTEMASLTRTVANRAELTVDLAPGVIADRVFDRTTSGTAGQVVVPLGTFSAGDHKTVLMRVRVPRGGPGERPIAAVRLHYDDLAESRPGDCEGVLATRLSAVTSELTPIDPLVSARLTATEAATTLEASNALFRAGHADRARALLEAEQQKIAVARRAAPAEPAVQQAFDKSSSAIAGDADGFVQPPAATGAAAASPPPPPAADRKGQGQVRKNQQDAFDLTR